jgi:HlyD family secretion protein
MDTSIFRKSALERLQNPERLDHLMRVTTPRSWIGLVALGVVTAAALLWGVFGTTPEQVQVIGIMLRTGGVYELQALGSGPVERLLVRPGARVKPGDVVAHVAQPQLQLTLDRTEQRLRALRVYRNGIAASLDRQTRIDIDAIEQQRVQATAAIATAEARVRFYEQRVDADQRALDRGLITPDVYQSAVTSLAQARDQLVGAQVTLRQLDGRTVSTRTSQTQQVFTLDQQIRDLEAQLATTREQLRQQREVVSAYDGVILEELVDVGETVQPGTAVYHLEIDANPLDVYLFSVEGKRVRPGMRVELVPSGVTPEEAGYMLGEVTAVSGAPLSSQATNRYLRNDALVRSFLGDQGAYLVEVRARADSATPSGFAWTTRRGPDIRLGSGTLLSGNIIVEERRPITLVIPALKKWVGA